MTGTYRAHAILGFNIRSIPTLIAGSRAIQTSMAEHTSIFVAPTPSLVMLKEQTDELADAQQLTVTRTKGMASARDAKRVVLVSSLRLELAYVQGLADANPEKAVSIIEAAAMKVAAVPLHHKPILAATLGVAPCTVELDANARALGRRRRLSCFHWQVTTDGGKTFVSAPSTPDAHTTIENLPPLTTCGFRVCLADTRGQGEWSQVVSNLVH